MVLSSSSYNSKHFNCPVLLSDRFSAFRCLFFGNCTCGQLGWIDAGNIHLQPFFETCAVEKDILVSIPYTRLLIHDDLSYSVDLDLSCDQALKNYYLYSCHLFLNISF